MTFAGPFRQHFHASADDRDSKILEFDPSRTTGATGFTNSEVAHITCDNSLVVTNPSSQTNTQMTMSVWVYPRMSDEGFENTPDNGGNSPHTVFYQLDEDQQIANSYLQITGNYSTTKGKVNFKMRERLIEHTVETINYNQWNHILVSMESAQNSNSTYNDKIHLVVNGTIYSKTASTSTLSAVTIQGTGDQLITSDNDFNFLMGYTPTSAQYTEGTNMYYGAIYQFYLDNQYYDMSSYSNRQQFYSTARKNNAALPNQSPLVLITDYKTFNSGTNDPGTVSRNTSRVTTSTLSKP